jgi:hypothetical protein
VIRPRLTLRGDAQKVLNETLLVENGLSSVRTAMDQVATQDPGTELLQLVEDPGVPGPTPDVAQSGRAPGTTSALSAMN